MKIKQKKYRIFNIHKSNKKHRQGLNFWDILWLMICLFGFYFFVILFNHSYQNGYFQSDNIDSQNYNPEFFNNKALYCDSGKCICLIDKDLRHISKPIQKLHNSRSVFCDPTGNCWIEVRVR